MCLLQYHHVRQPTVQEQVVLSCRQHCRLSIWEKQVCLLSCAPKLKYVIYTSALLILYLEFETLKLTRTQCEYIRVNARVCVCQYIVKQTCVSAHTAGCLNIDQSVQHHLHIHSWAFKHWSMYGTSHFQMQSWEWDTHYTTNWYKNTPLANLYNSSSDIETGAFASESDWPQNQTDLTPELQLVQTY